MEYIAVFNLPATNKDQICSLNVGSMANFPSEENVIALLKTALGDLFNKITNLSIQPKAFVEFVWNATDVHQELVGTDEYDTTDLNIQTTPAIQAYISMTPDERKEFCMDVLKVIEHRHDCNIGVNYEVLNMTADMLLDNLIREKNKRKIA